MSIKLYPSKVVGWKVLHITIHAVEHHIDCLIVTYSYYLLLFFISCYVIQSLRWASKELRICTSRAGVPWRSIVTSPPSYRAHPTSTGYWMGLDSFTSRTTTQPTHHHKEVQYKHVRLSHNELRYIWKGSTSAPVLMSSYNSASPAETKDLFSSYYVKQSRLYGSIQAARTKKLDYSQRSIIPPHRGFREQ